MGTANNDPVEAPQSSPAEESPAQDTGTHSEASASHDGTVEAAHARIDSLEEKFQKFINKVKALL